MSPIDDELRAALHERATAALHERATASLLQPDFGTGVERRAQRMRRNRLAASVAGTALAVSAIAVAVPMLSSSTVTMQPAPPATAPPSEAPSETPEATPAVSEFALDPADPWPYRGDPDVAVQGDLDAYTVEWAVRHDVLVDDVDLVPLFGQVYEPAATPELVYLVRQQSTGESWWGVARASESGPELLVDVLLPPDTTALPAALAGDEAARLLVVAAPGVAEIEYSPDAGSEWATMTPIAAGVAISPLDGDPTTDRLRVLGPAGEVLFEGPAPNLDTIDAPTNLLSDWPFRGDRAAGPSDEAVLDAFSAAVQDLEPEGSPMFRPLFAGSDDSGLSYVFGQAWITGREAYSVGLTTGGESGDELFLGPVTGPVQVLAFVACCSSETSTETLIVIPQPGTGQVLYAPDGRSSHEPVGAGQDSLDGVVLIERDPRAQSDTLRLLEEGNSDPDNPFFNGEVANLLCGVRECG